jgi:hypothetical protein
VLACDLLIAFTEVPRTVASRGGRHVELGIAVGARKRVWIVGPRENMLCWLDGVLRFRTWREALAALITDPPPAPWTPPLAEEIADEMERELPTPGGFKATASAAEYVPDWRTKLPVRRPDGRPWTKCPCGRDGAKLGGDGAFRCSGSTCHEQWADGRAAQARAYAEADAEGADPTSAEFHMHPNGRDPL